MEHAEAHERLSDLALEPRRLAGLADDPSTEVAELRAHLGRCDQCRAFLAGWQRTWAEIAKVPRSAAGVVLQPPPELRERVVAAVTREAREPATPEEARPVAAGARSGEVQTAGPSRLRGWRPWLIAAAAILVAVLGIANSLFMTTELARLQAENADLAVAAATLDRVLTAERSWKVTLRTADGTPGGTLAWSATEVVVIASGLPAPGPAQAYRCWLERDGSRTPIGWMAFSRSTGYWTGLMSDYGDGALRPGGRFGVTLVPAGGGGTPVLVGEL
jgi:hypothetical protein